MSIVSLPARRMYWSTKTRVPAVADQMTLNRFEEILSLLHVNDNELMKKRVIMDMIVFTRSDPWSKWFLQILRIVQSQSYLLLWMSKLSRSKAVTVYMKKIPKKWGYKIWALGGKSGYDHKFYIAGDNTVVTQDPMLIQSIGKSGEVVINLTENLAEDSYVFFDNYFSSPELLAELSQRKIHATSTLCSDRSRKCPLMSRKEIQKQGRGAYDYTLEKNVGVLICDWFDSKVVLMASKYT